MRGSLALYVDDNSNTENSILFRVVEATEQSTAISHALYLFHFGIPCWRCFIAKLNYTLMLPLCNIGPGDGAVAVAAAAAHSTFCHG